MQENQQLKGWSLRGTGGVVLALSAVILIAGGSTAWWSWKQLASPGDTTPAQLEGSSPTDTEETDGSVAIAPTTTAPVTVYLLDTTEAGMELVPITVDAEVNAETAQEPTTILTAAFDQLLQGDVAEEGSLAFSALPTETELLALTVDADGVRVDLSGTFAEGGGSASMMGRLTQVIYTATSLDAEQPVWLSMDGQPLELLGGEGLEISQPMTRALVDESFPLF
ncbi:MAG: GerMN domain-containing protein [Cyanobacteria bacterium P01_F01_bin.150]